MNYTRRFARLERRYPALPRARVLAQLLEAVAEGGLVLAALKAISHGDPMMGFFGMNDC